MKIYVDAYVHTYKPKQHVGFLCGHCVLPKFLYRFICCYCTSQLDICCIIITISIHMYMYACIRVVAAVENVTIYN